MPLPIAAIGGLAAKASPWLVKGGALAAKHPFMALMSLMFGYDVSKDLLGAATGLTPYGTQKKQIELSGKQMGMQVAMGRKEEARTDKLIKRLIAEQERRETRTEKRQATEDIRAGHERQMEMTLATMMALSGLQEQQGRLASKAPPSMASMLSLMR